MDNLNWKTGTLIALMVVGGLFEVFKSIPAGKNGEINLDIFGLSGAGSPYSVKAGLQAKAKLPSRPSAVPARMGGVDIAKQMEAFKMANAPTAGEFDHSQAGQGVAKVEQKEDDFEIYIDPVTGEMKKKKKKKKKKKAKAADVQEDVAQQEEPAQEEKDVDQAVANIAATGGFQTVTQKDLKKNPASGTIEDWIRILLSSPNLSETKRFISQYQNGKVTSQTFYTIVQMMLEDSRLDMKQLGVMAAGVTPSVRSFEMLAEMQRTQRDQALTSNIQRFLDPYGANLSHLSVLEKVLSSNGDYAGLLALHKLNESANRNLNPAQSSEVVMETEGDQAASLGASPNAAYYQRFLTVLENLTVSGNQTMAEEAKNSLTGLRNLLGTAPTQASAT